jgi:hypothetical protein
MNSQGYFNLPLVVLPVMQPGGLSQAQMAQMHNKILGGLIILCITNLAVRQ